MTKPLTGSEREIAEYFGLNLHTLRRDRIHERRFPFLKIGRSVRYNYQAVENALAEMSFPKKAAAK